MDTAILTPDIFMNLPPNSPPMTPSSRRMQIRSAPATRQSSPYSKRRMASSHFLHTPPLEYIEPTGQGHQFKFTRPQSLDLSSRPSSVSGRAYATTAPESDQEYESDDESEEEQPRPVRRTSRAHFVLEELDYDPCYDGDVEVLQPYHCEDARSEKSVSNVAKNEVSERIAELRLEQDSSDDEEMEEQLRRYRAKKKRWSKGLYKRSHSQSVEGDSSYSDDDPLDDNDLTARRLRRRVRGPCDRRGSLVFNDPGYANTNNIIEVDEPDEYGVVHCAGPPSLPSDDAFTLDELPFWKSGETMDLEFDSD